jgi:hypothetical protein
MDTENTEMKRIRALMNERFSPGEWCWKWWKGAVRPIIVLGHPNKEGGVCISFSREGDHIRPVGASKFYDCTAKQLVQGAVVEAIPLMDARGFDVIPEAVNAARVVVFSQAILAAQARRNNE